MNDIQGKIKNIGLWNNDQVDARWHYNEKRDAIQVDFVVKKINAACYSDVEAQCTVANLILNMDEAIQLSEAISEVKEASFLKHTKQCSACNGRKTVKGGGRWKTTLTCSNCKGKGRV